MSDIEANTYTSIETPPIIDGSDGNKGISPKKRQERKKDQGFRISRNENQDDNKSRMQIAHTICSKS